MVKSLPVMQETRVQSLGREDPLEKEMATCSSILAWKIPWMEETACSNTSFLCLLENRNSPQFLILLNFLF